MSSRDLRVPHLARRAQDLGARVAVRQTSRTPIAVAVGAGIAVEGLVRRALQEQQVRIARWYGLATRQEVLRLRETVRALEYRLEQLEETPAESSRKRAR